MSKKLAIFDIDGTIANDSTIPETVISGIQHLKEQGYIVTLSTGRAFVRILHSFGNIMNEITSDNALVISEHGTKINDIKGNVVFAEYFNDDDLQHILDFVRSNQEIYDQILFYMPGINARPKIWCDNESTIERVKAERGDKFDIFHSNFSALKDIWLATELSNIKVILKKHVRVHNLKLKLTRSHTTLNFQDGFMEFMKSNTNKGLAVAYLKKHFGVTDDYLLVAGNAINDQEMLNVPAKHRILVGPDKEREVIKSYLFNPDQIIEVYSPEDLGNFLLKI